MKNIPCLRCGSIMLLVVMLAGSSPAAIVTWTALSTVNQNWSTGNNWDTLTAPVDVDEVRFLDAGTDIPSLLDSSLAIGTLSYGQGNGGTHTTMINPGQTLTLNGVIGVADALYTGTALPLDVSTLVQANILGVGGTLALNGNLVVRQAHASSGAHRATLDLSGLDTFITTLGRILVGQGTGGNFNRTMGTLILARTNQLALSGTAPQLVVGDNSSNNNGNGSVSFLTLGQETTIWADSIRIGGQKQQGNMSFNAAFASPSLVLRGGDGASRVSLIGFGDNGAQGGSGNPTTGTINLGEGTIDVLADTVYLGRGQTGSGGGGATGNLTIGAGTFDVNTFEVGYQNAANAVGTVNGTVNVNNNFLFSTGAVLVVNNSLRLARNAGSTAAVNGTLTVNGGTVVANEIVGGGGNSTINVNAGTLILTNTAGTVAAPIHNLNLTDATLHVPILNAGAPLTTSNLTALGSQNVFHVTAVPPISAYPATFPLISYQSGAGGTFVLGTLPAASPAYAGEIVDLGDGVVALRLTAGPIVDLRLTWSGDTDGNWDSITPNWLFQGSAANFFAGSTVTFNDSAAVSDVVLIEAVSPGSVTVSNDTRQYTFTGSGGVAASILAKDGPGSLTLANEGANSFGTVTINNGILQLGNGGDNGEVVTLNITNHGGLVINRANSITLSSAISGTGSLTKQGAGTLILSGANSYNGVTLLQEGALIVNGALAGAGGLTSWPGTILAGSGTVSGAVNVSNQFNPGTISGPGIFRAHGGLTFFSGSTLTFDLSAVEPANPALNDQVEVMGNLVANNNTITVNIAGTPQPGSSYLLFTYSGNLSGSFNPVISGTHFQAALDTSTPGVVYLNVTGDAGFALKWNSQADNLWDSATENWLNLGNSTPAAFFAGDSVLFDDTAGVVTDITIGAGIIVSPAVMTNQSSVNNFVISGPGRISGSASVVKSGVSTLTLATANDFTGVVDVQEGVLRTGNGTALGTTAAGTTVQLGAALDLNGQNLGSEQVTVSGDGIGGTGVIVNSGGAQGQAFRQLVLAGDATFGGSANWGMNNSGGGSSLSSSGSPHKLTKVGPNQVTFSNTSIDGSLGDIDIQEGALQFSGNTASMGEPSLTLTVQEGASLQFGNNSATWNKQFVFHGNGATTTVSVGAGGNITLAGPVELHGNCLFAVTGPSLNISSVISGNGGFTKNGGLPLILTAANTYSGGTFVNGGTLQLTGDGSFDSSPNLTLAAGTTLNVSGRTDGTLTLAPGQSLHGDGTVTGVLNAGDSTTVSPGVGAVGELTVSGAVTLGGTTRMELDAANATNDVLRSASSTITYGGVLNLVSLSPLPADSSYKLFNATSYLGSFSSLNPATPGPGQTWDTSTLNTDGTLRVVGEPAVSPRPVIVSTVRIGSDLVVSGNNGTISGEYYVLLGTNIVQPLETWERITTNIFVNGNFTFTNTVNVNVPQQFYILQIP